MSTINETLIRDVVAEVLSRLGHPPAPSPAPAVTLEQVRAKMAEKSRAGRKDEVSALLKSFGATALSGIDPSRFAELLAAVEAI